MSAGSRDPWAWAGIGVVGVTAIVWSFAALSDLAHMVGVTEVIDTWWGWQIRIAWGLPITVDVLAVVATRVWLRGTAPAAAIEYACRAAWAAIVASIVGNGYHGLLRGNFEVDALIVSAVPAVVIGAIVHLAVLVARPGGDEEPTVVGVAGIEPAPAPPPAELPDRASTAEVPTAPHPEPPTVDDGTDEPPADSLGGERGISTTSTTRTPDEAPPGPTGMPVPARPESTQGTAGQRARSPQVVGPAAAAAYDGEAPAEGEPANATATPPRGIHLVKQPPAMPTDEAVERLLAEGAGRRRLVKETGLTEHQARTLIKQREQQLEAADA